MANFEIEEEPMLSPPQRSDFRARSRSMYIPMVSHREATRTLHSVKTFPQKSGSSSFYSTATHETVDLSSSRRGGTSQHSPTSVPLRRHPAVRTRLDYNPFQGEFSSVEGFAWRVPSFCSSYVPGVIHPDAKITRQWNKILAILSLVAIFLDPLFFFLLYVEKHLNCIVISWTMTRPLVLLRSINDLVYFMNMLLQFRLAYVAAGSRSRGTDLIDNPKKIARHYLTGFFFIDLFIALPLPQRVNQCLRDACHNSVVTQCMKFIVCGYDRFSYYTSSDSEMWRNNANATACLNSSSGAFDYGIYTNVVQLTTHPKIVKKYVYALYWGFQQITTLAGNQTPSDFELEVLFIMAITGIGLLLFALLIGNIQNYLQALSQRTLERQLRGRDVEQWMSQFCLPEDLRRRIRKFERYNWATTIGVNAEMLMENMPEDLQRDIRRHLFRFIEKIRIFSMMEEPVLDAICEKLRHKIYIEGSNILYNGGLVEKMVFVMHGKLESIYGEDGIRTPLNQGDVCGEELLRWYLDNSLVYTASRKIRFPEKVLFSKRTVRSLTNVEVFTLRADDLEEVIIRFSRFFRNPRVQAAVRYESPYWRSLAATRIQVAWRYRKYRLNHKRAASQTS